MNKRQILFVIVLTAAVALTLSELIENTIRDVNNLIEQECFDKLADTAETLANEIKSAADSDRAILTALAAGLARLENPDRAELCEFLNTAVFKSSYISYADLLLPDSTMLYPDNTVRNVADRYDFATEAAAGAYIAGPDPSTRNPDEAVIRHAVPVVRNGRTLYVLYGVIPLSEFAKQYQTDIYNGQAYVLLEDGDTGEFLLDTWHDSPGNLEDFRDRKLDPGYSREEYTEDLKAGRSGRLAFVSNTTGEKMFLRYEPTGINNWNIMVMVSQKVAMHEREAVSRRLYCMVAYIGTFLMLYMLGVTLSLLRAFRKERKLGSEDRTTGLQNRNAYNRYLTKLQRKGFDSLTFVFADVNGLHEVNNKFSHRAGDRMLQIVAGALLKEFSKKQVFRIGGDEFAVITQEDDPQTCEEKMERVAREVSSHDFDIAYGIAHRKNGIGADTVAWEADKKMLENKRAFYARRERPPRGEDEEGR